MSATATPTTLDSEQLAWLKKMGAALGSPVGVNPNAAAVKDAAVTAPGLPGGLSIPGLPGVDDLAKEILPEIKDLLKTLLGAAPSSSKSKTKRALIFSWARLRS